MEAPSSEDTNHSGAIALGKRDRDKTVDGRRTTHQGGKRHKHSYPDHALPTEEGEEPRIPIICRVKCNNHGNHLCYAIVSDYLNPPKMIREGSASRDSVSIPDLGEYLKENANISIIVNRTYSPNAYNSEIIDQFQKLQKENMKPDVVTSQGPGFYKLTEDSGYRGPYSETMTIVSEDLKNALNTIFGMLSGQPAKLDFEHEMAAPYLPFYHLRRAINQKVNRLAPTLQVPVKTLMGYLNKEFGSEYKEADDLFSAGLVNQKHLSKLFGANEVVVTMQDDTPRAYIVRSVSNDGLLLECESWSFDGIFRRQQTTFKVDWPDLTAESIPIPSSTIYPLRFDKSGLETRLRNRGNIFWECRYRKCVSYQGSNNRFEIIPSNPRFMVDMNTYHQLLSKEISPPRANDLSRHEMNNDEPPPEPFILLLPARIMACGLHDKKWRTLSVEHIKDVKWDVTAFDRLVLKPDKKELVKALVTVHLETSKSSDYIEGKGNGLIILLHGGPGTGKTLTAESVAELAHKPLYRMTCREIGTNAENTERSIESILYIARVWDCVLLLDEADVFLEERTKFDFQRNALVSIFLRAMEYYEGIIILTSNRVGTFDEAFKSRIQLALHYPTLDLEGRVEIWTNFIQKLEEVNARAKISELKRKIDILARHKLNGREIRNTVKTAMQLAHYRHEDLDYTHLQNVLSVTNEFEKYLVDTHGHEAADWAQSEKLRAPEHSE